MILDFNKEYTFTVGTNGHIFVREKENTTGRYNPLTSLNCPESNRWYFVNPYDKRSLIVKLVSGTIDCDNSPSINYYDGLDASFKLTKKTCQIEMIPLNRTTLRSEWQLTEGNMVRV